MIRKRRVSGHWIRVSGKVKAWHQAAKEVLCVEGSLQLRDDIREVTTCHGLFAESQFWFEKTRSAASEHRNFSNVSIRAFSDALIGNIAANEICGFDFATL